jgi:hypothetical protein
MPYKFNPFTKKLDYYEAGVSLVDNLKLVVNASVNKLDVFTKSGGAVPDATNFFTTSIPDGTGLVARTRKAAYLSGTSQFILADATAYWGVVSGTDKIKLHTYDIWDGTGIVHALSRYAGFLNVPTTTTPGDDDFFLLEDGSIYTRDAAHFCICTGHVWANYATGNTPDWTFYDSSTSAELAPVVEWNPKSNYSGTATLATTVTQASDIADDTSRVNKQMSQSGSFFISAQSHVLGSGIGNNLQMYIKKGSSDYSSAVTYGRALILTNEAAQNKTLVCFTTVFLSKGDYIHLGFYIGSASGNRIIYGDDDIPGETSFTFLRID